MSQLTVDQAIELALQHQRANKLADAESIFKQILEVYPDQADALHLLGGVYFQARQPELAEKKIREAIQVRREPAFLLTLGLVLEERQKPEEALRVYKEMLVLKPDSADGHVHTGVAESILGHFDEAVKHFQEAIRIVPGHVQAHGNLGIALCHLQRYEEAIWVLRAAISRAPKSPEFHATLGMALYGTNQIEAALAECREAAGLNPRHAQAQNLMGLILRSQGRFKEAVEPSRMAAELLPDSLETQISYGECLRQLGMLDDAMAHYRRVINTGLTSADLFNNIANVYKDNGLLDEAIANYRKSLAVSLSTSVCSNMIYTMHYHPGYSVEAIDKELRRYDELFAEPLKPQIRPHLNDGNPDRKLRIGYLSSDFRQHALGLNLVPLFSHHDKTKFEIVVYSSVDKPDFYTYRFRQLADEWREVQGRSDEQIAELVRQDRIDILIDLHQHMSGSRLLVHARKPAPVQIAFAGYPGSTGLKTIDFRLTDPYLEPVHGPQQPSSEKALRLPHSFWCYHAVVEVPVNELPAVANGYVTFGNLNNLCKFNEGTFELWAQVMLSLHNSRLILLAPEGSVRERIAGQLKAKGVDPSRVEFVSRAAMTEYYNYYHRIDIGLDAFPTNGHTTAMDSWWMGVPVTSYIGDRLFGRATWSQANNLGLAELVGKTPQEFVDISVGLARDLRRLGELRGTLRERMKKSPLCDDVGFARGIEGAYREAWRAWCEGKLG